MWCLSLVGEFSSTPISINKRVGGGGGGGRGNVAIVGWDRNEGKWHFIINRAKQRKAAHYWPHQRPEGGRYWPTQSLLRFPPPAPLLLLGVGQPGPPICSAALVRDNVMWGYHWPSKENIFITVRQFEFERTYDCITYLVGDDDYLMNETRRKPTTGRQSPSLCDKWHGIFYMTSCIDEAGHTKAFDYSVAEHWGESRNVQFRGWDSNRQHIGPSRTCYQLSHPGSPRGSHNPGSSTGGIFSQLGG